MDDLADSRGEAALPDHNGSAACSNVNMTSIDSGVETGNDSNDSSIVQGHEGQQQRQQQQHVLVGQFVNSNVEFPLEKLELYQDWFLPVESGHLSSLSMCCTNRQSSSDTSLLLQKKKLGWRYPLSTNMEMLKFIQETENLFRAKADHNYQSKIKPRFVRKPTCRFTLTDKRSEHFQRRMRLAATTNNTDMMKRLLESGVSPNNHDDHGRTSLHLAACRGYTEMVRLLLENGADPNQRDCIGNTPLHLAAVTSKLSVVTLLLTAGTDVLALDSYGYNPLQLAKTKLRMLRQNCSNEDMFKVKEEMHNVINMLLAYLQKQKNMQQQVETLSNFCSRLSLSNTSVQVQDDVKDLLENINALSITG